MPRRRRSRRPPSRRRKSCSASGNSKAPIASARATGCAPCARTCPPRPCSPPTSGRIFKTSSGRYYVPAAAERRPILAARRKCGSRGSRCASVRRRQCLTPADCPASAGDSGRPLYRSRVRTRGSDRLHPAGRGHAERSRGPAGPGYRPVRARVRKSGTPPLTLAQLYNRLTDPLRKFSRGTAAQAALRAREQAAALDLKPTIAEVAPPAPEPLAWRAEIGPGGAILLQ